jgi:hypothetical protein
LIPLTVPEVRRLVLAMAESVEQRSFRFGWSVWRRAHQALAILRLSDGNRGVLAFVLHLPFVGRLTTRSRRGSPKMQRRTRDPIPPQHFMRR